MSGIKMVWNVERNEFLKTSLLNNVSASLIALELTEKYGLKISKNSVYERANQLGLKRRTREPYISRKCVIYDDDGNETFVSKWKSKHNIEKDMVIKIKTDKFGNDKEMQIKRVKVIEILKRDHLQKDLIRVFFTKGKFTESFFRDDLEGMIV